MTHIEQQDSTPVPGDGDDGAVRADARTDGSTAGVPGDDDSSAGRSTRDGLRAVAMIIALAVVVAAGTVVWARVSSSQARMADPQLVPATLADGRQPPATPDGLEAAAGMPVIMAAPIDPSGEVATMCEAAPDTVLSGFVATDYASVLTLTDKVPLDADMMMEEEVPPGTVLHVACAQQWTTDGWQPLGHAAMPVEDDEMYPAYLCCSNGGESARYQAFAVPERAVWLLEDRGDYAVGYDVGDAEAAGIAAPESFDGMMTMHVWWVDDAGVIVGEEYAGG